jgi:hypothetical protein
VTSGRYSILIGFAVATTAFSQVDPKELVRQSIVNYDRDWQAQMSWAWTQTDITVSDDSKETEVSEFAPVGGTPFERLIRKDGLPLTAEEQRKENRKYEKVLREREHESSAERDARIRKYVEERAFVDEIPEAYNFHIVGEEVVEGRPAWVVEMTPRPGFVPTAPHAALLAHMEGKLWIDKQDVQWAKAEAHVIDTISIGWIVARIGPGARFNVEQTRVANGLWMPNRIKINGVAHVLLVHAKNLNEELSYSGYHEAGSASAEKR